MLSDTVKLKILVPPLVATEDVLTVYVGAVAVPAGVTSAELVPDNTTVCPAHLVAVITT